MDNKYDVIIIGSGLGGLECGVILSKEGLKVCVLEQGSVIGGCLQSYKRFGRTIDTGIHYIGSMDEGQIMRQYMKYFDIFDQLSIIRLDENYDRLTLGDAGSYYYKQGYADFLAYLTDSFPKEREGIIRYLDKINEIGTSIDVNVHKGGAITNNSLVHINISAVAFIESCVSDPILQSILGGINILHGGQRENANLYHHAMIMHSYLVGAYRFVGGTDQVADLLAAKIKEHGGEIKTRAKVTSIHAEGASVEYVELSNGERIFGTHYISSIHPATTFNMVTQTSAIKKAYRTRLSTLPNTYGIFATSLLMKPNTFPYLNRNEYQFRTKDTWSVMIDPKTLQVQTFLMSSQKDSLESQYSNVLTLLTPIGHSVFEPWSGTSLGKRGEGYHELKNKIENNLLQYAIECCSELEGKVERVTSASPLSYEHYTGVPQGSAYGILKDYKNSITSLFPTRTKLANLHLTGQNINVHGALGVTITAATTCAALIGTTYLAKKIGEV